MCQQGGVVGQNCTLEGIDPPCMFNPYFRLYLNVDKSFIVKVQYDCS